MTRKTLGGNNEMKKNLMLLAFSIFILISGSIAHADVINGDFTDGLNKWTKSVSGGVTLDNASLPGMSSQYAVLGTQIAPVLLLGFPSWGQDFLDGSTGVSSISQSFTTTPGWVSIAFDYYFYSSDNVGDYIPGDTNDDIFSVLIDFNETALQLSSREGNIVDKVYGHFDGTFYVENSISFQLSEAGGTFQNHEGTYSYVAIDNVSVGNPVPEPGTMVLLGSGLIGLAAFLKRSNKK
jgi:hypothetical protein